MVGLTLGCLETDLFMKKLMSLSGRSKTNSRNPRAHDSAGIQPLANTPTKKPSMPVVTKKCPLFTPSRMALASLSATLALSLSSPQVSPIHEKQGWQRINYYVQPINDADIIYLSNFPHAS